MRDPARAFRSPATWSAWRLCASDGGACRERADQLQRRRPAGRRRLQRHWEAERGRARRGGRPIRCQSRTRRQERGRPQRLGLVQGPQRLHQKAAECPRLQQARERHERGAAGGRTGGQLLTAKPVTSPDSARATEPRATETVLELRLGARFGSGMGERDRERALEEAAVATAARGKAVAASWPDSSLRDVEDIAGGAVVAAEAARKPAAVPAPPRTLEMPTATESSSSASTVSWAPSRRRSSPRDMEPQKARQRAPTKEGETALTKMATDAVRQRAPGASPWGARVASRQGRP